MFGLAHAQKSTLPSDTLMNTSTALRRVCRRAYSTATESSGSSGKTVSSTYLPSVSRRPKPTSPSFFTGAQSYNDKIIALEQARTLARRQLQDVRILPIPEELKTSLPSSPTAFKKRDEMSEAVEMPSIRPTQYKRLIKLLNEIHQLRGIAEVAKQWNVEANLTAVLEAFERSDKAALLARSEGHMDPREKLDEFNRSYALGKRKESAARVWIIPTPPTTTSAGVPESDAVGTDIQAAVPSSAPSLSNIKTTAFLAFAKPVFFRSTMRGSRFVNEAITIRFGQA